MPEGDTELELSVRAPSVWHTYLSPEGNLYIYIEEDDEAEPQFAIFKFFETGEAVEGEYVSTTGDGRAVKHLYWTNFYEGAKYDATRQLRSTSDVPEVSASGGSNDRDSASGQSQDV